MCLILLGILTISGQVASAERFDEDLLKLGEKLFFDPRLSADGKTSCATCHQPDKAFQDGRRVAIGVFGREGTRNTPSLLRVNEQTTLFWEGRRDQLEDQALDPILHAREQGLITEKDLRLLLTQLDDYREWLRGGDEIQIVRASLAVYERSLADGEAPFERYLFKNEQDAISDAAKRGWALFSGRARCVECHQVGTHAPAMFMDHGFHQVVSTGQDQDATKADIAKSFIALTAKGLDYTQSVLEEPAVAELGRFVVTADPKDIGRFKTPALRNVALTAPYMHDGRIATLAEAVDLEVYYRSRTGGRPLILLDSEKAEIVAFLESLTGESKAKQKKGDNGQIEHNAN